MQSWAEDEKYNRPFCGIRSEHSNMLARSRGNRWHGVDGNAAPRPWCCMWRHQFDTLLLAVPDHLLCPNLLCLVTLSQYPEIHDYLTSHMLHKYIFNKKHSWQSTQQRCKQLVYFAVTEVHFHTGQSISCMLFCLLLYLEICVFLCHINQFDICRNHILPGYSKPFLRKMYNNIVFFLYKKLHKCSTQCVSETNTVWQSQQNLLCEEEWCLEMSTICLDTHANRPSSDWHHLLAKYSTSRINISISIL